MNKKILAIAFAVLAAVLYAINIPFSKLLLSSIAPFVGTLLSCIVFKENLAWTYFVGLAIMVLGALIVFLDTLEKKHVHLHTHVIEHTHDGSTHIMKYPTSTSISIT